MTNPNGDWFKGYNIIISIASVFVVVMIISYFGNKENNIDQRANIITIPTAILEITPKKELNCHPGYSGCLNPGASDYDCIGGSGNGPYYTGRVRVIGSDVFGLDRDGDGWGCE